MSKNDCIRLFTQALDLQQKGHLDQAVDLCQKILRKDPAFVDAHMMQGLIFAQRNQWEQAARHFEKIVLITPRHLGARYNWG